MFLIRHLLLKPLYDASPAQNSQFNICAVSVNWFWATRYKIWLHEAINLELYKHIKELCLKNKVAEGVKQIICLLKADY